MCSWLATVTAGVILFLEQLFNLSCVLMRIKMTTVDLCMSVQSGNISRKYIFPFQ